MNAAAFSLNSSHSLNSPHIFEPDAVLLPTGIVRNTAVLVEAGRFAAVDAPECLRHQHPHAQVVPLPGRLLMPGFIDAHQHLTQAFGKALAFGEPSEIFKRVWVPLEGYLTEEMVYLSAKLASLEALRGGFTTVADAGTRSSEDLGALVRATEETGLRCVLGFICNDGGDDSRLPGILRAAEAHLSRFDSHKRLVPSLAISIPEASSDAALNKISQLCAESGRVFQTHVNEHLVAVERSLVARHLRPLEHLQHAGALGPQTVCAHSTLVAPSELGLLARSGAAVAYNPVASAWKGNAVAPALIMAEMGIRLGLGTDGTRCDAFRLADAAEAAQKYAFSLAAGDPSCGGGECWLHMGISGSADVLGLSRLTGAIQPGLAADFLLIDLDVPEFTPSWDLAWELVRFGNRDQIEAVFIDGKLRLLHGAPVDWDHHAMLARVRELAYDTIPKAPIQRTHYRSRKVEE